MPTPTVRAARALLIGMLTLAGVTSTAGALRLVRTGRIPANATHTYSLYVGMNDYYMTVIGQGRDSDDLDCWVYDSSGALVDYDTRYVDYCVLDTDGLGTHTLVIENNGVYTNRYEVHQLETLD